MEKKWIAQIEKEGLVKSEPALWVDSGSLMQNGHLILTGKNLYFVVNQAKKPALCIDLDTINQIKPESLHTDGNILCLTYLQYDQTRFSVLQYEDWEKALDAARMTPHIHDRNSSPIQGPGKP